MADEIKVPEQVEDMSQLLQVNLIPWLNSPTIRANILNLGVIGIAVLTAIVQNETMFDSELVKWATIVLPILTSAFTIYRRVQSTDVIITHKKGIQTIVEEV